MYLVTFTYFSKVGELTNVSFSFCVYALMKENLRCVHDEKISHSRTVLFTYLYDQLFLHQGKRKVMYAS